MRRRGIRTSRRIAALAMALVWILTGTGWAQSVPPPPSPPSANDAPGLTAMAGLAGAIGSFLYLPFKLGAICPGMALAAGVSLAVTGGDRITAEQLLRVGCAGTYFITPGMVRGQEAFQGSGVR